MSEELSGKEAELDPELGSWSWTHHVILDPLIRGAWFVFS